MKYMKRDNFYRTSAFIHEWSARYWYGN